MGNMRCRCPWSMQCCHRAGLRAKLCLMRFSSPPQRQETCTCGAGTSQGSWLCPPKRWQRSEHKMRTRAQVSAAGQAEGRVGWVPAQPQQLSAGPMRFEPVSNAGVTQSLLGAESWLFCREHQADALPGAVGCQGCCIHLHPGVPGTAGSATGPGGQRGQLWVPTHSRHHT